MTASQFVFGAPFAFALRVGAPTGVELSERSVSVISELSSSGEVDLTSFPLHKGGLVGVQQTKISEMTTLILKFQRLQGPESLVRHFFVSRSVSSFLPRCFRCSCEVPPRSVRRSK
jgi:hypothetical protein